MNEIYQLLNKYSFFQEREGYEIKEIQDYGRKSKFLVIYNQEFYTVLVTKERIKKYINRLNLLPQNYQEIIEFKYLSEDENVLVLGYYGDIEGHNLRYYNENNDLDSEKLANDLYNCIEKLHQIVHPYIDFDQKGTNWYEYFLNEITESLERTYNHNGITKEEKKLILGIVEKNKPYFDSVQTTYIHGDLTIINVCYNPKTDTIYLIDYDDFVIGDPLYDYSRIMNFQEENPVLKIFKEKYYPEIDNNIIHLLYTLRVTLNWYSYILDHSLDYELPILEIKSLLSKLTELNMTKM